MRVAVCLSRAIDPEQELEVENGSVRARAGEIGYVTSRADLCALELGLRLRDGTPGSVVSALLIGPTAGDAVLREAIAIGADEAILLEDNDEAARDGLETARLLADAARDLGADVVVCGQRSGGGQTGQVAMQIAALLGVPGVAGVVSATVEDGHLRVERRLDRGVRCRVFSDLPAVLAVEAGANRPRYPRLRARLRSAGWPVQQRAVAVPAGDGEPRVTVTALSRPRPTTKGIFVPDAGLSPEQQWEQLVSGGVPAGGAKPAGGTGSLNDHVDRIIEFLADGKYIS